MSTIKRRQFLQFAGSALTTIGLSQFDLLKQGDKYGKVLAQSTPRKLALLIGINNYPAIKGFSNLVGCETDVDLQQQLLIHRFGFNPNDIKILKSKEATREGILTTFNEHLVKQAKSGDVVVFHFSGHGSQIADPDKISPDGLNSTFLPADASSSREKGAVNDIMGRTLFLLMSALKQKTENVTVVLDSCHSGGGTRGNVRIRAADGGLSLTPSPQELEFQQTLMKQLNISPQELSKIRGIGVAAGVVLASAGREQVAADYSFPGFSAGAFTYLLTQCLWQQTSSVETVMSSVGRNIRLLSNQIPLAEEKVNSKNKEKSIYFLNNQVAPAEAVITEIKGNEATLWLGGIAQDSMEAFDKGATFVTLGAGARGGSTQVELKSRNGLLGTAVIKSGAAQPGALLQEFARAIPTDLKLLIGLDPSLGTDATTAKTAIQNLSRTEAISSQSGSKPYPQEVHYIFSRMTVAYRQQLKQNQQVSEIPAEGSFGLFSPSLELIPDSFGQAGENIAQAIARLQPKLKSLLAARIVKMTLNADSSRLKLGVNMKYLSSGQVGTLIGKAFTPRGCEEPTSCPPLGGRGQPGEVLTQQLPVGSSLQFEVTNGEQKPLYVGVLLIDPSEGVVVLFPNDFQKGSEQDRDSTTKIEAGATLLIPDRSKKEFKIIPENTGVGEVLVVASETPLTNSLLRLQSLAKDRGLQRGELITARGEQAVSLIDDLVQDLSGSRGGPLLKVRAVSANEMAALSITFEVVK